MVSCEQHFHTMGVKTWTPTPAVKLPARHLFARPINPLPPHQCLTPGGEIDKFFHAFLGSMLCDSAASDATLLKRFRATRLKVRLRRQNREFPAQISLTTPELSLSSCHLRIQIPPKTPGNSGPVTLLHTSTPRVPSGAFSSGVVAVEDSVED